MNSNIKRFEIIPVTTYLNSQSHLFIGKIPFHRLRCRVPRAYTFGERCLPRGLLRRRQASRRATPSICSRGVWVYMRQQLHRVPQQWVCTLSRATRTNLTPPASRSEGMPSFTRRLELYRCFTGVSDDKKTHNIVCSTYLPTCKRLRWLLCRTLDVSGSQLTVQPSELDCTETRT